MSRSLLQQLRAVAPMWLALGLCVGTRADGAVAQTAQTAQTAADARAHGAQVVAASGIASDSAARFLADARRNAERYRDRRAAVAEGFRQIGPDMPGMGEHWMQPGRMVSGRFNAAEPAVLTYITIDGAPVLTGVAYVLPLQPGQSPPSFPSSHAWHAHGGTVDEELLVALGPHGMNALQASGVRLAMLHAWVFVDNPAGPFEGNNWALPFTRVGLPVPASPDPGAAHALSLVSGGEAYYANLFRLTRALTTAEESAAAASLARAGTRVREILTERVTGVERGVDQERMAAVWSDLWRELGVALGASAYDAIRPFGPSHH